MIPSESRRHDAQGRPARNTECMTRPLRPGVPGSFEPAYPWIVVGLLWFCGFFNYADRQAVYSVFPLLKSGVPAQQ